jgi:hypothetical protein
MKAGITVALAVAVALIAVGGATAGTGGQAKAECDTGDVKGADYVYQLTARNLSCGKAVKLATEFNKCRHDNGGIRAKCPSFSGYSCKQKSTGSSEQIYQAEAKCGKGSKKFVEVFGELK